MRPLTDEQWARLAPCLPDNAGKAGRPFADHRRIIQGIIYRYRTGIPWRDLPRETFGPWQTVWKRHRRWAADGTWDMALAQLTAQADSTDGIDWTVSVDSTINRAHQHATNTARPEKDTSAATRHSKDETPATRGEPAGHSRIDRGYVVRELAESIARVWVGSERELGEVSDHLPLVLDLNRSALETVMFTDPGQPIP